MRAFVSRAKRANPYWRCGSDKLVAHECDRRSMPFGMWSRQRPKGLPKTATVRPSPARCAAVERPYGPVPTTTASYCSRDQDLGGTLISRARPHGPVPLHGVLGHDHRRAIVVGAKQLDGILPPLEHVACRAEAEAREQTSELGR